MALTKQTIPINFSQGLDTKTDPWQLSLGNFLELENAVFTTGKRLTKRNGFQSLPSLPLASSFLTTFNGDLTAIGSTIQAFSTSNEDWIPKGNCTPLSLSTLPLIRNNLNQTQVDSAISSSGLICTVYSELNNTTTTYKYVIADSVTGQNIISPQIINSVATYGTPRVFILNNYFILIYTVQISGVYHLDYLAIPIYNPSASIGPVSITANYTPSTSLSFDGVVFNNSLYLAWNGSSAGIKMALITSALLVSNTFTIDSSHQATLMSVTADATTNLLWASYYDSGTSAGYTTAVNPQIVVQAHFPTQIISSGTILNLTSAAQNGVNTVFYETSHTDHSIQTHFISQVQVIQASGAVSSPVVVLRSVGLASKAFIVSGTLYFLAAYSSPFQPTYFLINGSLSTSASPVMSAKLAYENGGGYLTTGLPSVSVSGITASLPYLFKDLVQALSNATSEGTTTVGGIYSQTGINLVSFTFDSTNLGSNEIGLNLNISGGYLIAYDGYSLVEQGFHLWPDSVQNTATATTGGHLASQIYFAQFTYEWTDNQGNAFRSAGSIPVEADLTGAGTSTNTLTWVVPTLRVTQKVSNPVKIVGYRWSTAQQVFYQFTSITAPVLNDPTVDSVTIVDTLSDASILGNNILYTTGGVIEDIGGPATSLMTLFDDRLFLVASEDQNLLWYSKQVIESTPVEMSDLLTIYVNPNVGSTGPTGPISALSTMDDKLILFKSNALNYISQGGGGPDNTGANSQYGPPTFITSMVGCSNQRSIVFQPEGLMFEFSSAIGNQIWILTRGLATEYIGSPVETLTKNASVVSAIAVPGTNQVRFHLSSGITLMYDYFYSQWGTFSNEAVSSTLYQDLHTYVDSFGQIFQESPGHYLDGSNPVLLSFKTAWINLAALQGYERFYSFFFLGQYLSPHQINIDLSYDYNESALQSELIQPDNFSSATPSAFGDQPAPFGSPVDLEQWKIHATQQKCQSFQISLTEVFDPTFGVTPGAGLSLSGLNIIAAIKRGSRPIRSSNTAGG